MLQANASWLVVTNAIHAPSGTRLTSMTSRMNDRRTAPCKESKKPPHRGFDQDAEAERERGLAHREPGNVLRYVESDVLLSTRGHV